jgi:uncharacterized membrane protein
MQYPHMEVEIEETEPAPQAAATEEGEEGEVAVAEAPAAAVTYDQIQPFLAETCARCHGERPVKELRVTDYDSLMAGGEDGPVVVPGAPDESLIIEVLTEGHFAQLSPEQMDLLLQWIEDGAQEGLGAEATAEPEGEAEAAKPVTYETLQPLFEQICGRCHGDQPAKGLQLTTYETLMAGGEDGPVVVPGAPDESLIIEVLTEGHFAQVTDEQMDLLRQWIEDGAQEAPGAEATAEPEEEAEAAEPVTYETLHPLFEQICGRCHGDQPAKGLQLTTYETLMAGSADGPVVVPGAPDESLIIEVLTEGHFAQVTDEQLAMLRQWIEDGAPSGEDAAP